MKCNLDCRNCEAKNPSDCDSRRRHDSVVRGLFTLAVLVGTLAAALLLGGCGSTGTYAIVGKVDAPIELSDSADTINIRALFSMTGAKVWSARDSRVKMTYTNVYTNSSIFGLVEDRGAQNFDVEVEPLDVSGGDGDDAENEKTEEISGTGDRAPLH